MAFDHLSISSAVIKVSSAATCSCVLSVCRLVQESCRLREFRRSASSCSFRWLHASWVWVNLECRACCSATAKAFCRREILQWSLSVTRRLFCGAQKSALTVFFRYVCKVRLTEERKACQRKKKTNSLVYSAIICSVVYNLCTDIDNHYQQICKGFSVCGLQSALINGCGCDD